jgi:hypothetical protein
MKSGSSGPLVDLANSAGGPTLRSRVDATSTTAASSPRPPSRAASVLIVLLGLVSESCGGGPSPKPAGSEGGPCYGNGTCESDLTCGSDLCVRISGSAGMPGSAGGGSTGASGSTGSGGAAGSTGTAGSTGSGGAGGGQPLKANGDLCSTADQCASGTCEQNNASERHCFGSGAANSACGSAYDCSAGFCPARTLSGSQRVCVPGGYVCDGAAIECTTLVVSFCQLIQSCASVSSSVPPRYRTDFDFCVATECATVHDGVSDLTPTQCASANVDIFVGRTTCP